MRFRVIISRPTLFIKLDGRVGFWRSRQFSQIRVHFHVPLGLQPPGELLQQG